MPALPRDRDWTAPVGRNVDGEPSSRRVSTPGPARLAAEHPRAAGDSAAPSGEARPACERHDERVVVRLARATVPKIATIVRKAYGGGHIALGGRPVRPDLLLAWPTAEMGFMAPETGVRTVYRRRLDALLEDDGQEAHDALVSELEAEWAAESEPWEAARNVILDDVIDPRRTREMIKAGIEFAWGSGPRVTKAGC